MACVLSLHIKNLFCKVIGLNRQGSSCCEALRPCVCGHRGGQPAEMLRQVAQRLASTARRGISISAICREGEDKGPKGMQLLGDSMTCIQKPAVNGFLNLLVFRKAQPSSEGLQQIEGIVRYSSLRV